MKCPKCGFENPSTMDYCGNCGTQFEGVEKAVAAPEDWSFLKTLPMDERGRVSLLLYLGAGMIALSGILGAISVAQTLDRRLPPDYTYYASAIGLIGFAIALVGFARQAKRMHE